MKKLFSGSRAKQSGFTLIELVIVMIIIGILAAVAAIKFANVTDAANKAANTAILGMVKSAWSAAFAVNKATPTAAQVAAQTSDPVCTAGSGVITCPAQWISSTGAAGTLSITSGADPITTASTLVCTTAADCN